MVLIFGAVYIGVSYGQKKVSLTRLEASVVVVDDFVVAVVVVLIVTRHIIIFSVGQLMLI